MDVGCHLSKVSVVTIFCGTFFFLSLFLLSPSAVMYSKVLTRPFKSAINLNMKEKKNFLYDCSVQVCEPIFHCKKETKFKLVILMNLEKAKKALE